MGRLIFSERRFFTKLNTLSQELTKPLYIEKMKYDQLTLLYNCIVTNIAPRWLQNDRQQSVQDNGIRCQGDG